MTALATPQHERASPEMLPVPASKQLKSLYEKKDGTLTAIGKDGIRRVVTPYILSMGSIGWIAREHADKSLVTSYPVEKQTSRAGRMIIQALMRSIVRGEFTIRSDPRQWGDKAALAKRAVEFTLGLRASYSSDHEHFDIQRFSEYQELAHKPSRRVRRIALMQTPAAHNV